MEEMEYAKQKTVPAPSRRNPNARSGNFTISLVFCGLHELEYKSQELKMLSEQNNWPLEINWDEVRSTITASMPLQEYLLSIVARPDRSMVWAYLETLPRERRKPSKERIITPCG